MSQAELGVGRNAIIDRDRLIVDSDAGKISRRIARDAKAQVDELKRREPDARSDRRGYLTSFISVNETLAVGRTSQELR